MPPAPDGPRMPDLIYGTAWKDHRTASLALAALRAGFRGIDTANQRKHYFEAGVGEAVRSALGEGLLHRDELFLQTKFTYVNGQDHRLPYDPAARIATQVGQSFASSLEHLGVEHVDSYVLHGPSTYPGLSETDWEAWRAMEGLQREGRTRRIGVSNVLSGQLQELLAGAAVKPAVVQNRTFTRPHADAEVRELCRRHGVAYQGFSLLTAIGPVLGHPHVRAVADRHRRTVAEVLLAYSLQRGIVVLTGTTNEQHMRQDLTAGSILLEADELALLDRFVGAHP